MLEDKIMELKEKIVKYAAIVREMIDKSVEALMQRDVNLAKEVIEVHEPKVNEQEILIDEECITAIARYQPEAKSLRMVMMISKMVTDLERMGDKAVNIAESAIYLSDKPLVKPLIDTPRMRDETILMLDDSITAFVNEDAALAYDVLKRDDIVDDLRDQILRELITYMLADPAVIERSLHLLRIARNLEKIADITSNICEEVIYIKEGKVVKHSKPDNANSAKDN
jgi:phosphate transport system protein